MNNNNIHQKSLELLDKLFDETPIEEINALIDSIDKMGPNGISVNDYFSLMDNEFDFTGSLSSINSNGVIECPAGASIVVSNIGLGYVKVAYTPLPPNKEKQRHRKPQKEISEAFLLEPDFYYI